MTKIIGTDYRNTTEIERLVFQAGGELRIVQNNLDFNSSVSLIIYNPRTDREISVRINYQDLMLGSAGQKIEAELTANTAEHARKTVSVKIEVMQKMVEDLMVLAADLTKQAQEIKAIIERKKS